MGMKKKTNEQVGPVAARVAKRSQGTVGVYLMTRVESDVEKERGRSREPGKVV